MSSESFNEPLPDDYFADGTRVFTRSKGSPEKRRDSLVDLLNDLRSAIVSGGYFVDPDASEDRPEYASIAEAIIAASSELPAGEPIPIELAMGKEHDFTTTLDGTRDVIIFAKASTLSAQSVGAGVEKPTILTGTLSMTAADGQPNRRMLAFDNVDIDFDSVINITSNWVMLYNNGNFQADINRTHGAAGARVQMNNTRQNGGSFQIIDSDDAPSNDGYVHLSNGQLSMFVNAATALTVGANVRVFIQNMFFKILYVGTCTFIDFQSKASTKLEIENSVFSLESPGGDLAFVENNSNTTVKWDGAVFVNDEGSLYNLEGSVGTHIGAPKLKTSIEPTNPPPGTEWRDEELSDNLIWDGTYWGNGSIYRKNLLVDVGGAAVSHSSGWTVPAVAGVINTSANALKALTGGGGATLYGISDGSDGDKFAESSALTQNSKASAKQASINVGGGDTIYVHSMTASGTEGGTLAGSNDEDVRVVVYFTMPKTLPSV